MVNTTKLELRDRFSVLRAMTLSVRSTAVAGAPLVRSEFRMAVDCVHAELHSRPTFLQLQKEVAKEPLGAEIQQDERVVPRLPCIILRNVRADRTVRIVGMARSNGSGRWREAFKCERLRVEGGIIWQEKAEPKPWAAPPKRVARRDGPQSSIDFTPL